MLGYLPIANSTMRSAAGADQGVVAGEPERKADQDRGEDRQPWPLCRVSDGRSRHSQKSLCRHSADDRGTAAAARCIDSVMRSVSRIPSKTGGKVRLDDGKFGKFSVRLDFGTSLHSSQTCPRRSGLANNHEQTQCCLQSAFIWRMSAETGHDHLAMGYGFCQRESFRGCPDTAETRYDQRRSSVGIILSASTFDVADYRVQLACLERADVLRR